MANDLNRWDGIGRLGRDPEMRQTKTGEPTAGFRMACGWKGKSGEGVEWITVVAFGKLAEIMGQYLRKGSQVYVSGRLRTREYDDRDGNKRSVTEVVANDMQMLGSRSDGQRQDAPQQQTKQQAEAGNPYDDDIPFAPVKNTW